MALSQKQITQLAKEQERLNFNNILRVEKAFPQIRMKIYNFVEFGKES